MSRWRVLWEAVLYGSAWGLALVMIMFVLIEIAKVVK